MSKTSRLVVTVLVALALVGVLIDPYTFSRTASDLIERPPWWQVLLGLMDIALLGGVMWWSWTVDLRRAWRVLIGETAYHVTVAIVLVMRDGIERFILGIGAQEIVSRFLLFILLRIVALYILMTSAERQVVQLDVTVEKG